jgi:hypothetical protein
MRPPRNGTAILFLRDELLSLYGDLDISVIDELPPNEPPNGASF